MKIDRIAEAFSYVRKNVQCDIASRVFEFKSTLNASVVPKVLPATRLPRQNIPIAGKILADPDFDKPGEIDLLLSAEYFLDIMLAGHCEQTKNCWQCETRSLVR